MDTAALIWYLAVFMPCLVYRSSFRPHAWIAEIEAPQVASCNFDKALLLHEANETVSSQRDGQEMHYISDLETVVL